MSHVAQGSRSAEWIRFCAVAAVFGATAWVAPHTPSMSAWWLAVGPVMGMLAAASVAAFEPAGMRRARMRRALTPWAYAFPFAMTLWSPVSWLVDGDYPRPSDEADRRMVGVSAAVTATWSILTPPQASDAALAFSIILTFVAGLPVIWAALAGDILPGPPRGMSAARRRSRPDGEDQRPPLTPEEEGRRAFSDYWKKKTREGAVPVVVAFLYLPLWSAARGSERPGLAIAAVTVPLLWVFVPTRPRRNATVEGANEAYMDPRTPLPPSD